MDILIDGHNVIGQLGDRALQNPQKEAMLLRLLQAHFGQSRHQVLVVFDRGQLAGTQPNLSSPKIQVVFARGVPADSIIKQRIAAHPRPRDLLVVTSDRAIQQVARSCHAQIRGAQDFAKTIQIGSGTPPAAAKPSPSALLSENEVAEWEAVFRQNRPDPLTK